MEGMEATSPGVEGVPQRQDSVDQASAAIGEACGTPLALGDVSGTGTGPCEAPSTLDAAPTPQNTAVLSAEDTGPPGPAPDGEEVANSDIDVCRRAVLLQPQEDDVCSICLDEFTGDDPGQRTKCGHLYHLQCVMQWAQRSKECPLCFKTLGLDNPELNELLPFGEYTAPPGPGHNPNSLAQQIYGVEPWELERLLQRLAVVSSQGGSQGSGGSRRRHRHRHRDEEGSSDRHRHEGTADAGQGSERRDGRHAQSLPTIPGHTSRNSIGAAEGRYPRASANRDRSTARRASFASGLPEGTSSSPNNRAAPSSFDIKSAPSMIRSRLMAASTKCKEFWRSATSSGPHGAGPSSSRP